jgi:protein-S-isoprenylcysteine O-methyltransferase Ste14
MAIAWGSTFLPTLMVWEPSVSLMGTVGRIISVCGMVLFVFACLDLDRSFGISPAVRPLVTGGVYKFLNHPLYVSHVIVECGLVFCSPSLRNVFIVCCVWGFYWLRTQFENGQLITMSR